MLPEAQRIVDRFRSIKRFRVLVDDRERVMIKEGHMVQLAFEGTQQRSVDNAKRFARS